MSRISWSDMYSIDDEELDGHHRQLIAYIQLLEDPIEREKRTPEALQGIVDGLVEYTDYHFRAEETRMRDLDYPEYEQHKALHVSFIKDITIFKDDFAKASPTLAATLLTYLKDWLITHILNNDMHFGDFMKSLGDDARGIETGTDEHISPV
ncbi:MAG: hypothetical protein DRJ42_21455 [Deltaproteobacteria bacterium]|nr:MAG: hypothetical protein DRJ42_21455 [Deltaproteobacteria bacterium]